MEDLIKTVKEKGMTSAAVTDHGEPDGRPEGSHSRSLAHFRNAGALAADMGSLPHLCPLMRGFIHTRSLAMMYDVETRELVQAVKRNIERFPADFMFQLTVGEFELLRSQSVISKPAGRGGRRVAPYAFSEQGVAMLSSVLRSPRAVQVNIEIMRAFVRLRQMLQQNADFARKLAALERRYDVQFKVVFDAIRELMAPPVKPKRRIGFGGEGGAVVPNVGGG
jgi:hypothetical protein